MTSLTILSVDLSTKQQAKYQLAESQKESVKFSIEQISNGEYSNQKEFFADLRLCLKEN